MTLLILGGTSEATALCAAIAARPGLAAVLSLAGRTTRPALPAVPYRIGGFGGVEGLRAYLEAQRIAALVDATHPFAARISAHAIEACAQCGRPLVAFTRPPWQPRAGDLWTGVPDLAAAAAGNRSVPRRVLLTVGRLGLAHFRAAPQHRYVIRTIDPPAPTDLPPDHIVIRDRGPFRLAEERALMAREGIDVVVTKNSGGTAAAAKLDAARVLGLAVIVVARPVPVAARAELYELADVLAWIEAHRAAPAP